MPDHDDHQTMLGPYALGHLDPAETKSVRQHLQGCSECRGELETIAPAVALLESSRPAGVDAEPPAGLEDRIVTAIGTARRSTPPTTLLGAAAAVLVVFGLAVGALLPRSDDEPDRIPVEVASVQDGVVAEAELIAHTWGTEVLLEVGGLVAGSTYDVAMQDDAGTVHDAGTFLGVDGPPINCRLNAAVLVPDVQRIIVTDPAGTEVIVATA